MTLAAGRRLGSYEILSVLGAGGMGEVYRARDTTLNRDVAIKVLLPAVANDPDRLARFSREAQVLASLNHPNIAHIHGLEESGGVRALVMELVEGDTLADRIRRPEGLRLPGDGERLGDGSRRPSGLPIDEALAIARQIAEALEAAHEQGVIHRDLKPANIKVRPDGTVKVLDFGLAKAMDPAASSTANATMSPTLSMYATQAGIILGTAAYMSPEQAKGKAVDRRADIWAFGVVVYEMLTGRMLFSGETAAETMAAVMMNETDLSALPSTTPAPMRNLLRRCLIKDPRNRLQSIGEARIALDEALGQALSAPLNLAAPSANRASGRSLLWMILFGLLLSATATLAVVQFRETPPEAPPPVTFEIPVAPSATSAVPFEMSPDGRFLAYWAAGAEGETVLRVRRLDSGDTREIPGSAQSGSSQPFWSADSRYLFFGTTAGLKRIEPTGTSPQVVCDCRPAGGTTNQEGAVVLWGLSNNGGLFLLPPSRRVPVPLTTAERSTARDTIPQFLPDGHQLIYVHEDAEDRDSSGVYLISLDKLAQARRRVFELEPGSDWRRPHLWTRAGVSYVLVVSNGTLMAHTFDNRAEALSEPSLVMEPVADFSVSANGVLVYRSQGGGPGTGPTVVPSWFDRQGKRLSGARDPGSYQAVALSPDGLRLATLPADGALWVSDLGGGNDARFVLRPRDGTHGTPVWAPDGSSIVFSSRRDGSRASQMYQKPANGAGAEELLLKSDRSTWANDWSRDGRFLIFSLDLASTDMDLMVLPMGPAGAERKPVAYIQGPGSQKQAQFSVDGRYVAYISDESGAFEVWVASFPDPSKGKWLISKGGGVEPRWSRDGKELFYFSGQTLMATTVRTDTAFTWSPPMALVEAPVVANYTNDSHRWQVSPDGKRFLLLTPAADTRSSPIQVIVNWPGPVQR